MKEIVNENVQYYVPDVQQSMEDKQEMLNQEIINNIKQMWEVIKKPNWAILFLI